MFGENLLPIKIGGYLPLHPGTTTLWDACADGGPVEVKVVGILRHWEYPHYHIVTESGMLSPTRVHHTAEGAIDHALGNANRYRQESVSMLAKAAALETQCAALRERLRTQADPDAQAMEEIGHAEASRAGCDPDPDAQASDLAFDAAVRGVTEDKTPSDGTEEINPALPF